MARILVGCDGSEAARGAATFAAQLARRLNDAVTLAYVVPPAAAEMEFSPVLDPARAAREHLAYAEELLGKAAAELGPDIQITLRGVAGHPAAALEELARDHDIELVAVGSHGLNPVERALLGSTASRLIRTCRKPVVVIPAAAWRTSGSFAS
jgi:nucleotide-binding universal stress UspA family protein